MCKCKAAAGAIGRHLAASLLSVFHVHVADTCCYDVLYDVLSDSLVSNATV